MASSKGRPDFLFFILSFLLICFGLTMVFSASAATSTIKFHSAWYFEQRQLMWVALGFIFMFFFMNIHYMNLQKWFLLIFIFAIILLFLVLVVGKNINGHKSWFGVGSFGIQPTEFAKLALVLYLAALISKKKEALLNFKKGLFPVLIVVGFTVGLIMLQPDIGSVIVILLASTVMIIVGGANIKHLLVIILGISPVALIIILAKSYRIQRFTSYLHPQDDSLGSSYQLLQSLYAFGHGGLTGTGFGLGIQKLFYLPEAHTDFIFSVIGEEFGLIGSVMFISIYLWFIIRGLFIAIRCDNLFGTLTGIGIISILGFQALINLGGATGSIPITGIPLPFISYGGSSLLFCMASVGIVLSISRENDHVEHPSANQNENLTPMRKQHANVKKT